MKRMKGIVYGGLLSVVFVMSGCSGSQKEGFQGLRKDPGGDREGSEDRSGGYKELRGNGRGGRILLD